MTPAQSSRILVFLSMIFGFTIAVLAILNSGAVGVVAVIGGMLLGLLWAGRSMFMKRPT